MLRTPFVLEEIWASVLEMVVLALRLRQHRVDRIGVVLSAGCYCCLIVSEWFSGHVYGSAEQRLLRGRVSINVRRPSSVVITAMLAIAGSTFMNRDTVTPMSFFKLHEASLLSSCH